MTQNILNDYILTLKQFIILEKQSMETTRQQGI